MADNYNVGVMLKARAGEHPDRPALIFAAGSQASFAELDRLSDRFAAGLIAKGLAREDRVLFLMRPSIQFYAALFGAIKMGAIPVLVDPGMGLKNVLTCIEEIAPKAMIALPAVHAASKVLRAPFHNTSLRITAGRRWFWRGPTLEQCLGPDKAYTIPSFASGDEVGIVFTSGSTGTPKGVSYTHGIFHAVATLADARIGREAGRTYLECFAAYVLFDVAQGMTSVVPDIDLSKPAKADPVKVLDAIQRFGCTGGFASPAILRSLFRHCATTGTELPNFSHVLTGVAPIPAEMHRGLRAANPSATLHVVYGATEGMTVAHTNTAQVLDHTWERTGKGDGNCVGTPFPTIDTRVIAITDEPLPTLADVVELPDGEMGELLIGGAVVSPEYKDRPKANALSKVRGEGRIWHRTGDIVWRDDSGKLWFCGRMSHRLRTENGMVPAVPVEGIYNDMPGVRRTALVGLGKPGHERPVLLVELEGGVAAWNPELERRLLARATGTRWEGIVELAIPHPGFPVDARHNSKIRRNDLKVWAREHAAPRVLTAS
ncbi:MAG: acyl-CoA synthetase (AMP-forming)/AMP-acid ligase II [Myxococcota bacterium]|jgi:acyl-CoA synthetase (AMP-forming)/AMP-acid ligase II